MPEAALGSRVPLSLPEVKDLPVNFSFKFCRFEEMDLTAVLSPSKPGQDVSPLVSTDATMGWYPLQDNLPLGPGKTVRDKGTNGPTIMPSVLHQVGVEKRLNGGTGVRHNDHSGLSSMNRYPQE